MNWLKFLVGFSALIIAGCAAYFSVTGLGVLFAGASISVMVMASALELAKLVAATYLKQKWDEIKGFNKWYLTSAVALLMLITSAGIFGYLSNAFQAQSLKLQVVDREIAVFQTKIDQNTAQITQLNEQLSGLSQTQSTILEKGKVNNRLLRSIDSKDRQTAKINSKIENLQTENAKNTEKINEIKLKNLDLEKEVGGFRFVADAFGMELKNVVKFFIFLIVIVFDPLAVALIIAFNGLIEDKKKKKQWDGEETLKELDNYFKNTPKEEIDAHFREIDKMYEVYGDTKEDLVENNSQNIEDSGKNLPKEEEMPVIMENSPKEETIEDTKLDLKWEEFMHPDFPWNNKKMWINNPKAVQYWLNTKGGSVRELNKIKNDNDNIKTY